MNPIPIEKFLKGERIIAIVFNNGNYITVNEEGFSFWDGRNGCWLVDASTQASDNIFSIGAKLIKQKRVLPPTFKAAYRKQPTRKRKKSTK